MQKEKLINKTKRRLFILFVMTGIVSVLIFVMVFLIYVCFFAFDGDSSQKNVMKTSNEMQVDVIQEKEISKDSEEAICIVLDAGHGGKDSGAISGNTEEKSINLSVALKLKKVLKENGFDVILTRERDEFLELSERVEIANNSKASLFISLHCNAFDKDDSVKGFECYYATDDFKSQKLAESIVNEAELCDEIVTRSAKEGEYYVLNNTSIPAVLVEMGFLTNPSECEKLLSEEYQMLLCQKMCDGVLRVLKSAK